MSTKPQFPHSQLLHHRKRYDNITTKRYNLSTSLQLLSRVCSVDFWDERSQTHVNENKIGSSLQSHRGTLVPRILLEFGEATVVELMQDISVRKWPSFCSPFERTKFVMRNKSLRL
jgi:hypothetical protein